MWKATIRGLVAHKLRFVLTAVAVLLGVAFVSGTFVLTDTMGRTFDDLFAGAFGDVDVVVRSETPFGETDAGPSTGEPVPASLLATVGGVPGVARAEGSTSGYAQIVDKQGDPVQPGGAPTIGGSWDTIGSPLSLHSGRPPRGPGEVAIDKATADETGIAVGDTVRILLTGPTRTFTVVGIARFGEADNLAGATLALFDLATSQQVLDKPGRFDAINVEAQDGVAPGDLVRRIAAALPDRIEAVTGQRAATQLSDEIKRGLGFFTVALLVFAGISLFVGAFIIANTFSIVVAQRARELGLLRAVGASSSQVMRSVLAEAAIVGAIASAAGVVAGIGLAALLRASLKAAGIELPESGTVIAPRTVIVGLVVGVATTVISAVVPARRAARVPPVEALLYGMTGSVPTTARRLVTGGVVSVLGLAALGTGLGAGVDRPLVWVGFGTFLVFVGVTLLSPVVAGRLASWIGAPAAALRGVPGRLAQGNAVRSPRRTASTAAALMVGLALVSMVAILASSIRASVDDVVGGRMQADIVVTSEAARFGGGMAPSVGQRLAAVRELDAVSPIRSGRWRSERSIETLAAVDPRTVTKLLGFDVPQETLDRLVGGGVLIKEDAARDHGVAAGDTITMEFARTGTHQVPVVGVYEEGPLLLESSQYVISLQTFDANFTSPTDILVLGRTAPGTNDADALRAATTALADFPNAKVQDRDGFIEDQAGRVNGLLGLISALLGLAIVIALLGITNTLALSVMERTRELGLLRAVGMTRAQMRSMIRHESVIVAVFGALLGLVVGAVFGLMIVAALSEQEGFTKLDVPFGQLAVYVVLAALAGVLAAIMPARRAARLDVLAAVADA